MRKCTDKLSREDWIIKSLDILSEKGVVRLNIDQLVEWIGVSKGSFYWHFKNRNEFIKSVFEYWSEFYTYLPANKLKQDIPDPEEELVICEEGDVGFHGAGAVRIEHRGAVGCGGMGSEDLVPLGGEGALLEVDRSALDAAPADVDAEDRGSVVRHGRERSHTNRSESQNVRL